MKKDFTVGSFMDKKGLFLRPEMPIAEAMDFFLKHRLLGAFVIDDRGGVVGVLSENDCLQVILQQTYYHQEPEDTVATYMREPPMAITISTSIEDTARLFLNNRYRHLPVMEGGKLVGQISRRELIRAMHRNLFSPKVGRNPSQPS